MTFHAGNRALTSLAASTVALLLLVTPDRPAAANNSLPPTQSAGLAAIDPQAKILKGVYWLGSTFSLKCLSASGASLAQASCSGDEAQRLELLPLGVDGAYVIKSVKAQKCLTVPLGPPSTVVTLKSCNHGRTQRWQIGRLGASSIQIKSLENKRCLSVKGASGRPVTEGWCNLAKPSLWSLQRLYGGPKLYSWHKTFGRGVGRSIDRTADGNYIVLFDAEGAKWPTLMKISAHGAVIWKRSCNAEGTKVHESLQPLSYSVKGASGVGVQQTSDGGYIVSSQAKLRVCAGGKCSKQHFTHLLKTDAAGSKQWDTLLRGQARMTRQTRAGGYVLVGFQLDGVPGDVNGCSFVSLDKAGKITWQHGLGPGGSIVCDRVVETADGGFVAAGFDKTKASLDVVVLRFDDSGRLRWLNSYGSAHDAVPSDLLLTTEGRFLVYGTQGATGHGGSPFLLEVDPAGRRVRETILAQPLKGGEEMYVRQLGDGSSAMLIFSYTSPSTVIKLDRRLRSIWSSSLGLKVGAREVIQLVDDRLIMVGVSDAKVIIGELSL